MHHYEIPIQPTSPLRGGMRVRVMALSRVGYHAPAVVYPRYEAYDPHVIGTLGAKVEKAEDAVTFIMVNECARNPVVRIKLTIKWIEGVTTLLPTEGRYIRLVTGRRGTVLEADVEVAIPNRRWACGPACDGPRPDPWTGIIRFV